MYQENDNQPITKNQNNQDYDKKQKYNLASRYLNASLSQIKERQMYIDAPRELPKKSYSLAPDMATGWKPKKPHRINFQNVFPLNFSCQIVDQIVKMLLKKNSKYQLVYLGPRKSNSYQLHEKNQYQNPYPIDKKIQYLFPQRPGISKTIKLSSSNLIFSSEFQSGNLDVAIKINENQFDLFMRVDSNTRGHTNWFYFQVENGTWVGTVKFNICNFRRERSLYQRGMKPFTKSLNEGNEWVQKGYNIEYQKKPTRYKFLYDQEDDSINKSLSTYYTMTFLYNFDSVNDKVRFAYCIPYTYSDLLNFIRQTSQTKRIKYETGWRSLSGLPIPIIQITDFQQPNHNKKVVLLTARIHPGQSNSSYVCHGLIKTLCSNQSRVGEMLKQFHFYIVPMLNPDGVIAGNYRTSLFGKDLNRTFNQSRKYAFPQSLNLIQLAKSLKKQHKQRFTIYLDLHGHSVKKNIFFYGPDYSISHSFYSKCRQFARILGNLTPMFRYYSCAFHISTEKQTTARATFNRTVNIPFTYTVESSNGAFYDSIQHIQKLFNAKYWIEMGNFIVKGLYTWAQNQNFTLAKLNRSVNYIQYQNDEEDQQSKQLKQKQPPGKQKLSDDQIQQGKSDSEPEDQDLNAQQLQLIQRQIQGKVQKTQKVQSPAKQKKRQLSPQKSQRPQNQKNIEFDWSNNLRQSHSHTKNAKQKIKNRKQKLPPINLQVNPVQFLGNLSHKKRVTISQALSNMTSVDINPHCSQKKQRLSISQMMITPKDILTGQQQILIQKKMSRQQLLQKLKKKR